MELCTPSAVLQTGAADPNPSGRNPKEGPLRIRHRGPAPTGPVDFEAPRRLQDASKMAQEAPRYVLEAPRCPQEAS